jgi:hypothetical protein
VVYACSRIQYAIRPSDRIVRETEKLDKVYYMQGQEENLQSSYHRNEKYVVAIRRKTYYNGF